MITIKSSGSTANIDSFLARMQKGPALTILNKYGKEGVEALRDATPVDSGLTAESWTYEIVKKRTGYSLVWKNTNTVSGIPVAILIQYGHGTGTGGWVEGRDYINPVIREIFDRFAKELWREVKRV